MGEADEGLQNEENIERRKPKDKRNRYSALNEDESDDDDQSTCSSLSGNAEFWFPEENEIRKKFIRDWNARYGKNDEPNDKIMRCENCTFGIETSEHIHPIVQCLRCGLMKTKLFHPLGKSNAHSRASKAFDKRKTTTPSLSVIHSCKHPGFSDSGDELLKCKRVQCVIKMSINNVVEDDANKIVDIAVNSENLKILGDQIRDSLNKVHAKLNENSKDWVWFSLVVGSGACDNVVDPRDMPGYPLRETRESRNGETFVTASGDPIPQLGKKVATLLNEGGVPKKLKTQCTTVSKLLLSVKRMTEVGHFVSFCEQGGFLLDLHIVVHDALRL